MPAFKILPRKRCAGGVDIRPPPAERLDDPENGLLNGRVQHQFPVDIRHDTPVKPTLYIYHAVGGDNGHCRKQFLRAPALSAAVAYLLAYSTGKI